MYDELKINQIGGFFIHPHDIDEASSKNSTKDNFFDVNAEFWSKLFNIDNICTMIDDLCKLNNVKSTKLQAIKTNPTMFIRTFNRALKNINNSSLNEQEFFNCLETLQMVCYLHTYLYSSPFELTVYEGYKHNMFSATELNRNCILQFCNPYYLFIKEYIIPKINYKDLKILWVKGRLNISGFCIAKLLKLLNPNIFIISIDNNSDFFSFNKIKSLLVNNHDLFSLFDCVALNDNQETYHKIQQAVKQNESLKNIENIIFTTDHGKTIISTSQKILNADTPQTLLKRKNTNSIIDIKLFPNNKCYWNKCTFCAINHKYNFDNSRWDNKYTLNLLNTLHGMGVKKFWAVDEAIPTHQLVDICEFLTKNNFDFSWHLRTRIEKNILEDNLPNKLSEAGVKHILFGFESASPRILAMMNKTKNVNTYMELAEKIVDTFNELQVFVHFPLIIGFPTETAKERKETFRFMNYLKRKYPNFSYNINILNFDVSSELYNHWEKYNISSVEYPCSPDSFLGNSIFWKCKDSLVSIKDLEEEASKQMKLQFNWYPKDALLDILSFYAMWEYSRNQLNVSIFNNAQINNLNLEQRFQLNENVSYFEDIEGFHCLYNFNNHQCIRGGKLIMDIVNEINSNNCIQTVLIKYDTMLNNPINQFIKDLIEYGFIVPFQLEERR